MALNILSMGFYCRIDRRIIRYWRYFQKIGKTDWSFFVKLFLENQSMLDIYTWKYSYDWKYELSPFYKNSFELLSDKNDCINEFCKLQLITL